MSRCVRLLSRNQVLSQRLYHAPLLPSALLRFSAEQDRHCSWAQTLRSFATAATQKDDTMAAKNEDLTTVDGPQTSPQGGWLGLQGAGSRDLRSDTMTTPTPKMLAAVQTCTMLDDVFGEDQTTISLEAHVAALCGMEAGLFVTSGTMGNQLGLRTLLTQPPFGVLCDKLSHIIQHEAGGVSSLTGATVQPLTPKNGMYLTLEDVREHAVIDDNVHSCPTRVINLENTLHGMITPLDEVERISQFARQHGIKMHCDGARLWEVAASGAGSLPQFCAHFDTVTLCFSKGLGAPVGSILVGSKAVIKHARWSRKSMGGGMRQPGFITAAARVAVDETFGATADGQSGWLRASHDMAKKVEEAWTNRGGKLVHPVQTNMCWLDIEAAGWSTSAFAKLGADVGLTVSGGRLVTHYQIAQNEAYVLPRLEKMFDAVFAKTS